MAPKRGPDSGKLLSLPEEQALQFQTYLKLSHVVDARGCWLYSKKENVPRPTLLDMEGRKWRPELHKISHAAFNGPVLAGLVVRHRCDNHSCFNPLHLLLGTQKENQKDKSERGRARNGTEGLPAIRVFPPGVKIPVGIRLEEELAEWALENAKNLGFRNRNVLIEELLRAFRAGTKPIRQPNAFPGESPDNPVLIALQSPHKP